MKKVVLVKLKENPEESSSKYNVQLNTSKEQPEKTLQCIRYQFRHQLPVEVPKIQYDCINVTNYDAFRNIRIFMSRKEALQFMANEMKYLEHLKIKIGFYLPFFSSGQADSIWANRLLSKDWQKAFCDFLKSQEQTLTKVTLLFPCAMTMSQWRGPTGRILDFTKFIYESINKFCPNVHTVDTNSHLQRNEFFPYPMLGAWKNSNLAKCCGRHFFLRKN